MSGVINLSRAMIFLAGLAAGTLARRPDRNRSESSTEEVKQIVAELAAKVAANQAEAAERFQRVDARLDEQATKLAEIPSTAQIVSAMEQILARSMASLDERLANQAHSIEVLRSTVAQTDTLLERVLESIDSLQTYPESSELATDTLLHRPAV
jgi:chromosome segregation ATPase